MPRPMWSSALKSDSKMAKIATFRGYGIGILGGQGMTTKDAKDASFWGYGIGTLACHSGTLETETVTNGGESFGGEAEQGSW